MLIPHFLTGSLPEAWSAWSNLYTLYLNSNALTGTLGIFPYGPKRHMSKPSLSLWSSTWLHVRSCLVHACNRTNLCLSHQIGGCWYVKNMRTVTQVLCRLHGAT